MYSFISRDYLYNQTYMKIISPRFHGYLDYATALIFLGAPALLGITGIAAVLSYALAVIHAAMTLITDFPLGVTPFLSLQFHGWVECIVGPVLIVFSFVHVIASTPAARGFYLMIGIVILIIGIISDYKTPIRQAH
jgi:hypothetical protein